MGKSGVICHLLIKWANRSLELRPRLFLRTVRFLWQKPHRTETKPKPLRNAQMCVSTRPLRADYSPFRDFAETSERFQVPCRRFDRAMARIEKPSGGHFAFSWAEFFEASGIHSSHEVAARIHLDNELGCEHAPYRAHHGPW